MGSKDQPMITQKNLHCTVGSLVLDYTEIEEVLLQLETLNNTSAEINEILSSDDVMNLKLRFTEWKFNANDGNFGFQFDCCESQNHQMHKDDLLQMIRNSPANLDDEVDFPLIFEQLKAQNQYDEKTGMLTLTRLQKIRIDLKVAGAQIKSIWRGTFMVLGWTQFATALQNHPNRHDFLINTERLTKPHISKTHTIPELTESFYEARTMNRPHCIVNGRVGNKVTVLPFDIARV